MKTQAQVGFQNTAAVLLQTFNKLYSEWCDGGKKSTNSKYVCKDMKKRAR